MPKVKGGIIRLLKIWCKESRLIYRYMTYIIHQHMHTPFRFAEKSIDLLVPVCRIALKVNSWELKKYFLFNIKRKSGGCGGVLSTLPLATISLVLVRFIVIRLLWAQISTFSTSCRGVWSWVLLIKTLKGKSSANLKEQYPVTAHAPNFDFWTGCREIKRCEESKRTLKNPFASRLAEFNTTLKLLRITDQWFIVLVKLRFGRNRDFLAILLLPLAGKPKDRKRFDADLRLISSTSFHT